MALSPASMMSIISTWPNAASAAGDPKLAKSWTIECQMPARPSAAAARLCRASSIAPERLRLLLVHRREEILVGLGVLHLVEQELHRVDGAHLHQDPAQHPHLGELG